MSPDFSTSLENKTVYVSSEVEKIDASAGGIYYVCARGQLVFADIGEIRGGLLKTFGDWEIQKYQPDFCFFTVNVKNPETLLASVKSLLNPLVR